MMRVRVYADRPDCGTLKQGGEYRMQGTLAISQYGAMPLWLTDIASVERIRGPNLALRTIGMMQQAFFEQTSRLSDQRESARSRPDLRYSQAGLRSSRQWQWQGGHGY